MLKDKTLSRILLIALILYITIAIILSIVSFINVFWLCGWLIGGISSIVSYLIGTIFTYSLFKKAKSKFAGILLGWSKNFIQIIFFASVTFAIIAIDTWYNQVPIFHSGVSNLFSPIDFISYLFGIGIMPLSIVISIIDFKKIKMEKHESIQK